MNLVNGMKFVDDPQAIGKWEFYDVIIKDDDYNFEVPKSKKIPFGYKEVYFLPQGQGYWIFEGWKKGTLLVCHGGDEPILCFDYKIKIFKENKYMFIYETENKQKRIIILKKVDSKKYTINDIRRTENIDIIFKPDDKIVGNWKTVGYVEKIKAFNPKQNYQNDLWLKSATFKPDGTVLRKYYDCEWLDKWSKGVLLDQKKSIVSKYVFKEIDGKEYMFLEWKMGNYVYGGMPPEYYVFEKEN